MIRVEVSRDYPAPAATAFDYITDPARWPDYWPDLIAVDTPDASWAHPGDEMQLRMRFTGRPVTMRMKLDRLVRPEVVAYRSSQPGLPEMQHERHFEPLAAGFRYRISVAYQPRRGLTGLFDRTMVRRGLRRALVRTLDNLDPALHGAPGG